MTASLPGSTGLRVHRQLCAQVVRSYREPLIVTLHRLDPVSSVTAEDHQSGSVVQRRDTGDVSGLVSVSELTAAAGAPLTGGKIEDEADGPPSVGVMVWTQEVTTAISSHIKQRPGREPYAELALEVPRHISVGKPFDQLGYHRDRMILQLAHRPEPAETCDGFGGDELVYGGYFNAQGFRVAQLIVLVPSRPRIQEVVPKLVELRWRPDLGQAALMSSSCTRGRTVWATWRSRAVRRAGRCRWPLAQCHVA